MNCPYCGQPVKQVTGEVIYPHRKDLYHRLFYACLPCDAYVGSHESTGLALGRLANRDLRQWKMKAHAAFDPLWKSRKMKRFAAYKWLAGKLGLSINACHIGEFDIEMCRKVVDVMNEPR